MKLIDDKLVHILISILEEYREGLAADWLVDMIMNELKALRDANEQEKGS